MRCRNGHTVTSQDLYTARGWKECNICRSLTVKRHKVSPEYKVWSGIIQRCENPNNNRYDDWGGRGIKMCEEWRTSFDNFLRDMGNRPSPKHQIDRIDNDGDYSPENCKWSDLYEQSHNTRRNRWVEYDGRKQTIDQWALELGLKYRTLHARLVDYHWPIERALTGKRG